MACYDRADNFMLLISTVIFSPPVRPKIPKFVPFGTGFAVEVTKSLILPISSLRVSSLLYYFNLVIYSWSE